MAANTDEREDLTIKEFHGLRNNVKPADFEPGDLVSAQNVDIDAAKRMRRRKGYATSIVGTPSHSVFSSGGVNLAGQGASLVSWTLAGATATLRTGLTGGRLSYVALGGRIYYSDGTNNGCVEGGASRTWGIVPPVGQPALAAVGGNLPAGDYQTACTFLRADGQESGTSVAALVSLPAGGGIAFSSIPVSSDPGVTLVAIYAGYVDGGSAELRRIAIVPNGTTAATYDNRIAGGATLTTQHLEQPVAGQFVAYGHGRMLVARGPKLYYSTPFMPEHMDRRRAVPFPGYITFVGPVKGGVWVGTQDEIVFLEGTNPAEWVYAQKEDSGAIIGAWATVNAEDVEKSLDGMGYLVGTTRGIVLCLNDGTMSNLTKDRFRYPTADRGAAVVRAHGGMDQYLMVLEGTEIAADDVAF